VDEPRGTILIVDDEESDRITLLHRLQSAGYTCMAVADGEGALWKTSTQEFDLVLLDMELAGQSGMDLLSQIVAAHPDTCVIMMTEVAEIQAGVEAMKQGAYDYVTKPFCVDDLGMRIEKALERRRLVLENREHKLRAEQNVAQLRKYMSEAVQVLGLEQMAPDKTDAVRQAQRYAKRMFQIGDTKDAADMEEAYLQMARTLASIAEAREPYASGHSDRVGLLANEIAIKLNCSTEMVKQIKFAAILQDIGKIVIPDRILSKQEQLTPEEHNEINRHPTASVEIIQHVDYFKDFIPLVESHHEWFDGSGGYPKKLKGEDIPLGARILSVADAYDAMTCPRPHRVCLVPEEAARNLKKGAGKQWDPLVVDALLKKLGMKV